MTAYVWTPATVRAVVPPGRAGAYVLGTHIATAEARGRFRPGYVGRSDVCVRGRLAAHERLGTFDYFLVRLTRSVASAHALECEWWHACRQAGTPVDNRVHPAAPRGSGLDCPYCHLAEHVARLLAA